MKSISRIDVPHKILYCVNQLLRQAPMENQGYKKLLVAGQNGSVRVLAIVAQYTSQVGNLPRVAFSCCLQPGPTHAASYFDQVQLLAAIQIDFK